MDNFREWLSDNLRYFMLGGVILIIVIGLFFGVRACVGSNKGNSDGKKNPVSEENQGNVPSSPTKGENDEKKEKDANPMEKADADTSALIENYYKALGENDIAALKSLEDDITPSDEAKITIAKDFIEGYEVREVSTKKGLDKDSYVVYVSLYYICPGIDAKVPALSSLYVYKDSAGKLVIDNDAIQDREISDYMDKLTAEDEEVKKLVSDAQKEYEQVQVENPELAEFLDNLGEETGVGTQSETEAGKALVTGSECNIRAEADINAEILGVIPAGTRLEEKGVSGEWTQIEYEGQNGYVYTSLLEKTE